MGHGCPLGGHPDFGAVREHADDLRGQIAEHGPSTIADPGSRMV